MTTPKLSYTVREAVVATGMGEAVIRAAINSGRLRTKRNRNKDGEPVGRHLILAAALQTYLDELADG